ncbi:phosphohydrolase [Methanoculleus taiwanensis]|uniref:Phosphohydrolase n=1 Tax=Methanoculleus taiwanensis TaxID=1550565 RepID=A0A498H195_9EURY|nr:HD domain-containing protein [Methanoculleus taiwanensis]RXE56124.1 phosphohydrolase [Methanoculleus taiwanensis]
MDERVAEIREHVRTVYQDSGAHGFDHTVRVTRLCELLGAREGANMGVLIPAALFHDIARPLEEKEGLPHEEEGARMAESYLRSMDYPGDLIPGIAHAIRAHRYSTGAAPETLEAQILSDADKLDAMGAVGIARTFMQAGERGGGIADATAHFHEKLLQLQRCMYTESARSIAGRRHAFLTAFLEALDDEMNGHLPRL